MKQYHYFISYRAFNSKEKIVFGMCEFLSLTKISSFEDIMEVRSQIEEKNNSLHDVTVANYQLIRNRKY